MPRKINLDSVSLTEALRTRRDWAEQLLLAAGVEGHALEAVLNESAHLRHAHRVKLARQAAEDYYLEQAKLTRDDLTPETLNVHVAIIVYLDICGIGGHFGGVTGSSTIRHPAFERCGKGRKRATDGEAWNSAIDDLTITDNIRFAYRFTAHEDGHMSFRATTVDVSVESVHGPAAWRLTLAREGLRRAAGLEPMICVVPMEDGPETLVRWSKVVNSITDELQQAEPRMEECTQSTCDGI
jgi:hypothetical protein